MSKTARQFYKHTTSARLYKLKALCQATRPRTFPLAFACILCGNGLAFASLAAPNAHNWSSHNWLVFALTLWVALALQILSNLANDYGDGIKGTDDLRDSTSPQRMTASGQLSAKRFKWLIYTWALLTFCSGVALISIGFDNWRNFLLFLAFGIIAIIAAMAYTMGKRPYGYRALGEVAVLVFFGWLGVLGSAYLHTHAFDWSHLLPATGCGLLAACVLYINNMRDVYSDKQAGKLTLAILLGEERMQFGYYAVLALALLCYVAYGVLYNAYTLLWLPVLIVISAHLQVIKKNTGNSLHPSSIGNELKRIVLITLFINMLFVMGILVQ